MRYRAATPSDADRIAALHADSWRRHYRGAYSDAFLDGDVEADRRSVWGSRLAVVDPPTATIVAEQGEDLAGFVHVVLDDDPQWGSLLDNLHVAATLQRQGVGSELISRAGQAVVARAATPAMYLWVLEQNSTAQAFYARHGGRCAERALVGAPGGVAGRLNGAPVKLRYVWSDAAGAG